MRAVAPDALNAERKKSTSSECRQQQSICLCLRPGRWQRAERHCRKVRATILNREWDTTSVPCGCMTVRKRRDQRNPLRREPIPTATTLYLQRENTIRGRQMETGCWPMNLRMWCSRAARLRQTSRSFSACPPARRGLGTTILFPRDGRIITAILPGFIAALE